MYRIGAVQVITYSKYLEYVKYRVLNGKSHRKLGSYNHEQPYSVEIAAYATLYIISGT